MKFKQNANIICICIFVFLTLLSFLYPKVLVGSSYKYLIMCFVTMAVFLIPGIIMAKTEKQKISVYLNLRRFKMRWLPATFFCAVAVSLLGIFLNVLFALIFRGAGMPLISSPFVNLNDASAPEIVLCVAVFPAVFEELFFRGAYLKKYSGTYLFRAVFTGSAAFAFMHASPYSFIAPFVCGIAYGFLVYLFDSIYPAILAHLINNVFCLVLWRYSEDIKSAGLVGLCAAVGIILMFVFTYFALHFLEPHINKIKPAPKLKLKARMEQRAKYQSPFDRAFLALFILWALIMTLKLLI